LQKLRALCPEFVLRLVQFWEVVGGGLFGLCERWGEARIFYGRYRRVRYLGKILVTNPQDNQSLAEGLIRHLHGLGSYRLEHGLGLTPRQSATSQVKINMHIRESYLMIKYLL
jgi:hypothetical protein